MRIPRIYQPLPLAVGQLIELDAQATVHLTKVLRLKAGDVLQVFNSEGGEFKAQVREVGRRSVSVEIGEWVDCNVESSLELILLQGVSRGERMDYTVQKAVELGVSKIIPIMTERTVVNLKGDRKQRRCNHWQAVVNSACEQSGRNCVPEVAQILDFQQGLSRVPDGLKLVLHHRADAVLDEKVMPKTPVTLLVGPEGGLSPNEIAAAEAVGFMPWRLGPRVMRTETAAVAALAVLQWQWGDF